jgi:hypothetical protein
MVPLLVYHRGLEPQEAIDYICQLINDSHTAFEGLVPDVLALASKNGVVDESRRFVTGCKDVGIGLVNWLYEFPPE